MIRSVRVGISKKYRHITLAGIVDPDLFWDTVYGQFRTRRVQENIVTPDDDIQPPAGDDLFIVWTAKREYRARSLERLRNIPGVHVVPGGRVRLLMNTLLLVIQGGNTSKKSVTLYRVFPTGTTLNDIAPIKRTHRAKKIRLTPAQLFSAAFIERVGVLRLALSKYKRDATCQALVKKGVLDVTITDSAVDVTLTPSGAAAFANALDGWQLNADEVQFLRRKTMGWIGASDWKLAQLNFINPVKVNGRVDHYELTPHGHRKLDLLGGSNVGQPD